MRAAAFLEKRADSKTGCHGNQNRYYTIDSCMIECKIRKFCHHSLPGNRQLRFGPVYNIAVPDCKDFNIIGARGGLVRPMYLKPVFIAVCSLAAAYGTFLDLVEFFRLLS